MVTWKPLVSQISKQPGVTNIFNSSQIPGEILDLTVVRTDVLNRADGSGQKFAKALAGAWYETMALMSGQGPATAKVLTAIAEGSQDSLESYKEQLSTTHMLYTPQSALQLATSPEMKQKMTLVKQFCFSHGLLGENTKSSDDVAIRYSDSTVQGKPDRVRLRFETAYMQMSRAGGCELMSLLNISVKPSRAACWTLSWLLFATGIGLYFYTAQKRHKENPDDRVVPTLAQLGAGIYRPR